MMQLCDRLMDNSMSQNVREPIPSYHIMPDLSNNIENFSGEVGTSKASDWIKSIESMKLLHHWPENFALETVRSHMKDGARDWFRLNNAQLFTWTEFWESFKKSFVVTETLTVKWKKCQNESRRRMKF